MPACGGSRGPIVICNIPELNRELQYRSLESMLTPGRGEVAVWIEPLAQSWRSELEAISSWLPSGGKFYIIASRPLASFLPERSGWQGRPLGVRIGGLRQLHRSLNASGFRICSSYGIHNPAATGLNAIGKIAEYFGRPDTGDRLRFAARLRYCTPGPLAAFSAVSLIEAIKVGDRC